MSGKQTDAMEDDDWDAMEASTTPFSEFDPVLAASLLDLFQVTMREHLSDEELGALESIRTPPRLDVGRVGDANALKLTFFGGQTWMGWDGTSDDARVLVRELAELAAASVSGDVWISGDGWRSCTETPRGPGTQDSTGSP